MAANYTVGEMRRIISSVYPGEAWKERVKRMYDGQVIAIFYSFKEKGKLDEFGRPVKKKTTKYKGVHTTGVQLRFW